jgi:Flp pilus assembly protein CpaB
LIAASAAGVLAIAVLGHLTQTASVIVAAHDIQPFEVIESRMLKAASMPLPAAHPKAYRWVQDVAGKRAAGPIPAGQQVLRGQTVDVGNGYGKTGFEDCVVMFVPMPASRCVAGLVRAGDVVDLIYSTNEQRGGTAAARTILRRVPVLADVKPSGRTWDAPGTDATGLNLLLTPKDAETVALCLENGTLYACLSAAGGP